MDVGQNKTSMGAMLLSPSTGFCPGVILRLLSFGKNVLTSCTSGTVTAAYTAQVHETL